jgi:hypothetical protein
MILQRIMVPRNPRKVDSAKSNGGHEISADRNYSEKGRAPPLLRLEVDPLLKFDGHGGTTNWQGDGLSAGNGGGTKGIFQISQSRPRPRNRSQKAAKLPYQQPTLIQNHEN